MITESLSYIEEEKEHTEIVDCLASWSDITNNNQVSYGRDQLSGGPKIGNRKFYYSRKEYLMNFIPNESSSKMAFISTE